jgi:hypothetical protein
MKKLKKGVFGVLKIRLGQPSGSSILPTAPIKVSGIRKKERQRVRINQNKKERNLATDRVNTRGYY